MILTIDPYDSDHVSAQEVAGQHIGRVVQFVTALGTGKVHAWITGELRQVYHRAGETVLYLCSPREDTAGSMEEYVLTDEAPVRVLGSVDATDYLEVVASTDYLEVVVR